jgi:hypothetical protein
MEFLSEDEGIFLKEFRIIRVQEDEDFPCYYCTLSVVTGCVAVLSSQKNVLCRDCIQHPTLLSRLSKYQCDKYCTVLHVTRNIARKFNQ